MIFDEWCYFIEVDTVSLRNFKTSLNSNPNRYNKWINSCCSTDWDKIKYFDLTTIALPKTQSYLSL